MADDARSDAALRHNASRSKQPRVVAEGKAASGQVPLVKLMIQFDHYSPSCGSHLDEIDASHFIYTGVSTMPSERNLSAARRTNMDAVSQFKW